ncbi:hypothetical protein ACLOJK_029202, partial [Asimina triloba]
IQRHPTNEPITMAVILVSVQRRPASRPDLPFPEHHHMARICPAPFSPIFIVRFFHRASNHLSTHRRPWTAGTPPSPIIYSRPRHHQAMMPQPQKIQQLATPSSRHLDGLKPVL